MSDFAAYAKIDALNWSSIKHMHTSGLYYRHRVDHPEPYKPAFGFGGAIHTAVFEPERLEERYAVYRDGKRDARHKKYQEFLRAFSADVVVLLPDEWDRMRALADVIRSHPLVRPLLTGGRAEVTIEWVCPYTDVKCKGRIDYLSDRVIDLKSTTDVGARNTGHAYANYLYHGQMAFYHNGALGAGLLDPSPKNYQPPAVIWAEKEPPFDVAIDQFDYDDIAAGTAAFIELITKVKQCAEADEWPGKAPEPRRPNIPPYALGAREDDF